MFISNRMSYQKNNNMSSSNQNFFIPINTKNTNYFKKLNHNKYYSLSKVKDISIINENPFIIPIDCKIQLENYVFTDKWSIPYRKDKWFGRILISTIALLKEDLADSDINCNRFINIVYPKL